MAQTFSLCNTNLFRGDENMEMAVQGTQKKSLLRNEKGLTLIELLAVIVILGIIAAIAIPSVSSIISKSKVNTHRANAQLIVDAARNMVLVDNLESSTSTDKSVDLDTLFKSGYLETMPKDPQGSSGKYNATDSKVTWTESEDNEDKLIFSVYLYSESGVKYFDGAAEDEIKTIDVGK